MQAKRLLCVIGVVISTLVSLNVNGQQAAVATAVVVNGFVVDIALVDGGAGYKSAPAVAIVGGGGSGATATAVVSDGSVIEFIVFSAGSGYTSEPTVRIGSPFSFGDGVIAFLPFNGDAWDETGSGFDGIVFGAELTADRFGFADRAYYFNGVNNRIALARALPDTQEFSFLAWIHREDDANRHIFSDSTDDGGNDLDLNCQPGNLLGLGFTKGGKPDSYVLKAENVLLLNEWFHVAMVLQSTGTALFVNGSKVASTSMVGNNVGWHGTPTIGAFDHSGFRGHFFKGAIDDVRIYGRGLSDAEVRAIYLVESPDPPTLSVSVKTVQVDMFVKPGRVYQVQSSFDLAGWTDVGDAFLATEPIKSDEFDVLETGRFFRVVEVP